MAKSENLTVLLTDIVNFSEKTAASTRADMGELMRIHNRLLKSTVRFYGGQYVKSTGDGMLAVFRTTTNAVQCGMAIQDTIAEYNKRSDPEQHLHVRVALNLGEVSWARGDIVGEAVNVTARIEEQTPADEVYFSGTVYLAMNKAEVPTRFVDKMRLKGVSEPVAIHMVPRNEKAILIATGEPIDDPDNGITLPFGGMPRPSAVSYSDRLLAIVRQPLFIGSSSALLSMLLLIVFAYTGGWLSPRGEQAVRQVLEPAPLFTPSAANPDRDPAKQMSEGDRLALKEAEALLEEGKLDELRSLIQDASLDGEPGARAKLLQGHLAHRNNQLQQAMKFYRQALQASPQLKHNDLLARNLVATLGYQSKPAAALIEQYTTNAMIDYLAQRSGQLGPIGHGHAVRLLKELGEEQRIDHLSYGRRLLEQARECSEYKHAIRSLQKSGDPVAVPLIKGALGEGIGGWFRSRCWRDEAEAAIAALQSANK